MRKPTKGEVVQKIAQAWCSARNSHKEMDCAIAEDAADAVMALFEDKPTPKWEEEFKSFELGARLNCAHTDTVKDFIREKLREMYDDVRRYSGTFDQIKEKWGL